MIGRYIAVFRMDNFVFASGQGTPSDSDRDDGGAAFLFGFSSTTMVARLS